MYYASNVRAAVGFGPIDHRNTKYKGDKRHPCPTRNPGAANLGARCYDYPEE